MGNGHIIKTYREVSRKPLCESWFSCPAYRGSAFFFGLRRKDGIMNAYEGDFLPEGRGPSPHFLCCKKKKRDIMKMAIQYFI